MIRALFFTPEGKIRTDINQGEFILLLHEDGGILWIDMHGEDKPNYKLVMERIFEFHPLAVDDALEQTQVPKVDDWGKYLYLVLHDFEIEQDGDMLVQKELGFPSAADKVPELSGKYPGSEGGDCFRIR